MSLILEALRKSEAERRRGVAPSVYSELPPSAQVRTRAVAAWVWPLAGALVLAGLWFARGVDPPRPTAAEPPAVAHVDSPSGRGETALPPVPHLSPMPETPAMPATAPAVVPAHAQSAPTTQGAQALASAPVPQLPATPRQIPVPIPNPVRPPPVAARAIPAEDSGTLRLSDLSAEQRKALPPMKLSMHMWNDDPAQRFVILDGNRLHEGDRIGDAVVTAITADGVLLDWNGRRLKLPIR